MHPQGKKSGIFAWVSQLGKECLRANRNELVKREAENKSEGTSKLLNTDRGKERGPKNESEKPQHTKTTYSRKGFGPPAKGRVGKGCERPQTKKGESRVYSPRSPPNKFGGSTSTQRKKEKGIDKRRSWRGSTGGPEKNDASTRRKAPRTYSREALR